MGFPAGYPWGSPQNRPVRQAWVNGTQLSALQAESQTEESHAHYATRLSLARLDARAKKGRLWEGPRAMPFSDGSL